MLAGSDSQLPEELDPELMSRLIAWFAPTPQRAPSREDEELRQMQEVRDRAIAAVDPQLHAHLEHKGELHAAMVRPLPPVRLSVDPAIARFDFAVWGLTTAGEILESERPDDIQYILRENSPQAVLRDLYRPVHPPGRVFYEETPLVPLPGQIHDIVTRAMATSHAADMTEGLSPSYILRVERDELRATLDAPWEESKPEQPSDLGSAVPDLDNLFWFGQG